jgi:hypothetical protein
MSGYRIDGPAPSPDPDITGASSDVETWEQLVGAQPGITLEQLRSDQPLGLVDMRRRSRRGFRRVLTNAAEAADGKGILQIGGEGWDRARSLAQETDLIRFALPRLPPQDAADFGEACRLLSAMDEARWETMQPVFRAYVQALMATADLQKDIHRHKDAAFRTVRDSLETRLHEAFQQAFSGTETDHARSLGLFRDLQTDAGYIKLLRSHLTPAQFATLDVATLGRGTFRVIQGGHGREQDDADGAAVADVVAGAFGADRREPFLEEFRSGRLHMHVHEVDGKPMACIGEFVVNERFGVLDWLSQAPQSVGTARAVLVAAARTCPRTLFCDCNWHSLPLNIELLGGIASGVSDGVYPVPYAQVLQVPAVPQDEADTFPAKLAENEDAVQKLAQDAAAHPGTPIDCMIGTDRHQVIAVRLSDAELDAYRKARERGDSDAYLGKDLFALLRDDTDPRRPPAIVRAVPTQMENGAWPRSISFFFGPNRTDPSLWKDYRLAQMEHAAQMDAIHHPEPPTPSER